MRFVVPDDYDRARADNADLARHGDLRVHHEPPADEAALLARPEAAEVPGGRPTNVLNPEALP